MFLQILPPENLLATENVIDNQLLFVVLGLAVSVFLILRANKFLSKIKITKNSKKPVYNS